MINQTKTMIIGAGNVGSTIAYDLIIQGICNDIIMIDNNRKKAAAQVLDLQHCLEENMPVRIKEGTLADCDNADIVVITAALPLIQGQTRLDMVDGARKIMDAIVPNIMETGFDGFFIIATNPVDIISDYVYRLSNLPKNHIIGTGTALDTVRLRKYLADKIEVDATEVHLYCLGEHGDSLLIPWSIVTVGGKPIDELINDNKERFDEINKDEVRKYILQSGWMIAEEKGTTNYGIASTTVSIIKSIIYNENRIIPISTLAEGEYGIDDIFIGLPAVLNSNGVKEILELKLLQDELKKLNYSANVLKNAKLTR